MSICPQEMGGDMQFQLRVPDLFIVPSASQTLQPTSDPTARSVQLLGEMPQEWGGGQRLVTGGAGSKDRGQVVS